MLWKASFSVPLQGYPGEMIQWGGEAFCTSFFRLGGKFLSPCFNGTSDIVSSPFALMNVIFFLLKEGVWQGEESRNGSATVWGWIQLLLSYHHGWIQHGFHASCMGQLISAGLLKANLKGILIWFILALQKTKRRSISQWDVIAV